MNRDHIDPMATISYTGTVQWQPDPEPFGDVISEQPVGSGHDPLIRYPGQWRLDPVLATTEPAFTTLYYNTHRWYNPSWGRYTQGDPLGLLGAGTHLFLYAAGNPLLFIDPHGLSEKLPCDKLARPDACTCDVARLVSRADEQISLREIFCNHPLTYIDHLDRLQRERGGRFEQVGGMEPAPWYRDVGDACMNWCICEHERQHDRDFHDPRINRTGLSIALWDVVVLPQLECRAYNTSVDCLKAFLLQ